MDSCQKTAHSATRPDGIFVLPSSARKVNPHSTQQNSYFLRPEIHPDQMAAIIVIITTKLEF
jgi:hypothetical protein